VNSKVGHLRGFSLIELMFSMAIGSVILILAANLLGSAGTSYERISSSVSSEDDARTLLNQLAADLSSATQHQDTLIEKSTARWPIDRLGFLSVQPQEVQTLAGSIGDLCAVSYYVKDLEISHQTVRCLMRGFRESGETFKALHEQTVTTLLEPRDPQDEPVAFGVVSFEARPVMRDGQGKWIGWVRNKVTPPEALAIRLVLARRGLTAKLKLPADWDGSGSAQKLLGEASTADRHKDLKIYSTTFRFGNDSKP
jgi:prepilin-type N-terminal cleavage/methylation domain-containing protein